MIGGITGLGFGIDAMVMQSDDDAETFIAAFENCLRNGVNPNAIEQIVYQQTGIDPDNFTYYDKEKIQRKVEAAVSAHLDLRG